MSPSSVFLSLPVSYTRYCDHNVSSDSSDAWICSFLCIPSDTRSAFISDRGAVSESTNDAIDDFAKSLMSAYSVIAVSSLSVIAMIVAPLSFAYPIEFIVLAEYLGKDIPIMTSPFPIGMICSKSSFVHVLLTSTTSSKRSVM